MFKVKVKIPRTVDIVNKLRNTVDDEFIQDVKREVIEGAILPLIAAGVSPVEAIDASRRFAQYKDREKYPGKKKSKSPANLFLTGEMLSYYLAERINGLRFRMGILPSAPKAVKDRAEGNNVGTTTEDGGVGIPARRFVPLRGETFRITVMRKLKNLYARRIRTLLSSK